MSHAPSRAGQGNARRAPTRRHVPGTLTETLTALGNIPLGIRNIPSNLTNAVRIFRHSWRNILPSSQASRQTPTTVSKPYIFFIYAPFSTIFIPNWSLGPKEQDYTWVGSQNPQNLAGESLKFRPPLHNFVPRLSDVQPLPTMHSEHHEKVLELLFGSNFTPSARAIKTVKWA